jgi:hypothetical protein
MLVSLASADPRDWDTPLAVRQGTQIQWDRSTASDADGNVLTVWADARTGDLDVYAQMVNADGISEWAAGGIPVVTAPKGQTQPKAIAVSDGWIIVWGDYRATGNERSDLQDIRAQKLDRRGNILWWQNDGTGVMVEESPIPFVFSYTYYLTPDGFNGALVVWLGADVESIGAQRLLADGSTGWNTPRVLATSEGYIYSLNAAPDSFGNLLVTWLNADQTYRRQVFATKVTVDGNLPWGENGVQISPDYSTQSRGITRICGDGAGGAVIIFSGAPNWSDPNLLAQRLNAVGAPQWSDSGITFCNAPRAKVNCKLVPSRLGGSIDGVLVVWEDARENAQISEIYAQKLSMQGIPLWQANGLKVCGDAGSDTLVPTGSERLYPELISDDAGGMICIWHDLRDATYNNEDLTDLYAGRILADGSLNWGESGVLVANGPNRQTEPSMLLNAGIMVLYSDSRTGSISLAAQRLNLSGQRLLGDTGTVVMTGWDGSGNYPQTVAMSGGRVASVWTDTRSHFRDEVYCQITNANGDLEKPVGGVRLETTNTTSIDHLSLCADGSGGFFVICPARAVQNDARRIYVIHVNSAGNVDSNPTGVTVPVPAGTTDQLSAMGSPDGQGGVYVAWDNYDYDYQLDSYVARLNAACQSVWSDPLRLTNSVDDDRVFGLVTLTDGSCMVGWRSGAFWNYDLNVARILPQGTTAFSRFMCDSAGNHDDAKLLADSEGGAWGVWTNIPASGNVRQINAQRFSAQGSELWAHNGVAVGGLQRQQSSSTLAHDSDGNLFVLWNEFAADTTTDIYGQKLSPEGLKLWGTAGLAICVAAEDQNNPQIVSDGGAGMFAVWDDRRLQQNGRGTYMFGTHLQGNGSPVNDPYWVVNGSALGNIAGPDHSYPVVCNDGASGFFVAWTCFNNYESEGFEGNSIFAQHIQNIGSDAESAPALAYQFQLAQNYPNPFNPATTISFSLPQSGQTRLTVYNLLGEEVTRLTDRVMPAGQYRLSFDGKALSSGIYFYRLESSSGTLTKRMLLLK